MSRLLLEELHAYFSEKETLGEKEKHLLLQLTGELPYFNVTSVSRDDLEHLNFDVSNISDAEMVKITSKMGDDYCNQLFWTSLDIIAEDSLNIPRKGVVLCPICRKHPVEYDSETDTHYCTNCDAEWSNNYVLIEFPKDASHFENEDIGFPCYNSDDNGARYVPEYDYIKHFGKKPEKVRYFKPVSWPESQQYVDDLFCELIIADEKGLKEFDPSSFWVPVNTTKSTTENEKYKQLIDCIRLTSVMSTCADVECFIAKYYGLEKYMEYFENYDKRFSEDGFEETESDIEESKTMHNEMMEEIKKINPDESTKIEEALSEL